MNAQGVDERMVNVHLLLLLDRADEETMIETHTKRVKKTKNANHYE